MLEHPSEELLSNYAVDPSLVAEAAALEAHLADCEPCRRRLDDLYEIEVLLADPETWRDLDVAASVRAPDALSAAAARNRRENAEAEALLAEDLEKFLSGESGAFLWADVPSKREYHTAGVVRKLARAADEAQYRAPRRALVLAETATVIVGMLSRDAYSAEEIASLRGLSWKQQANANRQLGRFPAALAALERAERAYRETRRPELDLASITFIRATIYAEQQTYALAQPLAEESSATFARLGQTELYFGSRLLQGWIAFEQRELGEAQLIFDTVFAYGEATNNLTWIACGSQALGNCHLERRDFVNATQYLHRSMLVFRELGILVAEIRSRWGLALIVQREGRHRSAITRLRGVRDEFANVGAISDAALVTLDLMETFLLLRQPSDVRRAAGDIVKLFKEAGMATGALTAADYLKQAAAMGNVTPGLIDYIRRYLRRVELQPDLAFAPPAPL